MRTDYLSRLGDEVMGKVWDEFSDSRGQLIEKVEGGRSLVQLIRLQGIPRLSLPGAEERAVYM